MAAAYIRTGDPLDGDPTDYDDHEIRMSFEYQTREDDPTTLQDLYDQFAAVVDETIAEETEREELKKQFQEHQEKEAKEKEEKNKQKTEKRPDTPEKNARHTSNKKRNKRPDTPTKKKEKDTTHRKTSVSL